MSHRNLCCHATRPSCQCLIGLLTYYWYTTRGQVSSRTTYTNLSHGTYVFSVAAATFNGQWNTTPTSLRITIVPQFWQTKWFQSLCLLSLMGLVLLIYRLRTWQLLKREQDLKQRIDEAVTKIKVLNGLIPICSNCKKIRDDKGFWQDIAKYIKEHSQAVMTHGICPECREKLYGPVLKDLRAKG